MDSGNKLSQSEIDDILKKWKEEKIDTSIDYSAAAKEEKVFKAIDFKKPSRLKNDNFGAIKQIHDAFAKLITNYLSVIMRVNVQAEADINNIDQVQYKEYIETIAGNNIWGIFDMPPLNQARWFMQMDSKFCSFFLERVLGGKTNFDDVYMDEKISEINKEAFLFLMNKVAGLYTDVWNEIKHLGHFEHKNMFIEDDSQNIHVGTMSNDMLLIIPIRLTISQKDEYDNPISRETMFSIGMPFAVIEPILDKLNIKNILSDSIAAETNPLIKKNIENASLDISIKVGSTQMLFKDLLNLKSSDIMVIDKKISEPFELMVNGKAKSNCYPFTNNSKLSVKITK